MSMMASPQSQMLSAPAQASNIKQNNPQGHPTSISDVSQPKQLIEGSTLDALHKALNPQPVPQKPKIPNTENRFLVSSIMNPVPAKQPKPKRGRRGKKLKTAIINQNNSQMNIPTASALPPQSYASSSRRVPSSMMMEPPVNTVSFDVHPSRSMTVPVHTPLTTQLDDIDGTEISDDENMDISGDEAVTTTYITNSISTSQDTNSNMFSAKFAVEVILAEQADKLYPPKTGEIYKTGSSLFRSMERPYSGTVFDSKFVYFCGSTSFQRSVHKFNCSR